MSDREQRREATALAMLFHETYERLAPQFGYEPRPETSVPWDEVPEPNKSLMIAVAEHVLAVLGDLTAEKAALTEERDAAEHQANLMAALYREVEAEHTALTEALRFYREPANYVRGCGTMPSSIEMDCGRRAEAVLVRRAGEGTPRRSRCTVCDQPIVETTPGHWTHLVTGSPNHEGTPTTEPPSRVHVGRMGHSENLRVGHDCGHEGTPTTEPPEGER